MHMTASGEDQDLYLQLRDTRTAFSLGDQALPRCRLKDNMCSCNKAFTSKSLKCFSFYVGFPLLRRLEVRGGNSVTAEMNAFQL